MIHLALVKSLIHVILFTVSGYYSWNYETTYNLLFLKSNSFIVTCMKCNEFLSSFLACQDWTSELIFAQDEPVFIMVRIYGYFTSRLSRELFKWHTQCILVHSAFS